MGDLKHASRKIGDPLGLAKQSKSKKVVKPENTHDDVQAKTVSQLDAEAKKRKKKSKSFISAPQQSNDSLLGNKTGL